MYNVVTNIIDPKSIQKESISRHIYLLPTCQRHKMASHPSHQLSPPDTAVIDLSHFYWNFHSFSFVFSIQPPTEHAASGDKASGSNHGRVTDYHDWVHLGRSERYFCYARSVQTRSVAHPLSLLDSSCGDMPPSPIRLHCGIFYFRDLCICKVTQATKSISTNTSWQWLMWRRAVLQIVTSVLEQQIASIYRVYIEDGASRFVEHTGNVLLERLQGVISQRI